MHTGVRPAVWQMIKGDLVFLPRQMTHACCTFICILNTQMSLNILLSTHNFDTAWYAVPVAHLFSRATGGWWRIPSISPLSSHKSSWSMMRVQLLVLKCTHLPSFADGSRKGLKVPAHRTKTSNQSLNEQGRLTYVVHDKHRNPSFHCVIYAVYLESQYVWLKAQRATRKIWSQRTYTFVKSKCIITINLKFKFIYIFSCENL